MTELEDYLQAPPKSVMRLAGQGRKKLQSSAAYAFRNKSTTKSRSMSCAMHAINILMMWIIGRSILEEINQIFPLVDNVGISYGMLCSIPLVYEKIAWSVLPLDLSLQGSGM